MNRNTVSTGNDDGHHMPAVGARAMPGSGQGRGGCVGGWQAGGKGGAYLLYYHYYYLFVLS